MTGSVVLRRLFQASLFCFALFVPFSIAGMTIAFGFGALAWVVTSIVRLAAPPAVTAPAMPVRRDPLLFAAILLVVSAVPSVLISQDSSRAVGDWTSYWKFFIYFLVAGNVLALGMREVAFWTLVVAAALSSIVGIIQRAGGLDAGFIHIGPEYRVSSTLFTMTFAGILYQLIVFNFAVLLRRGMRARWRVLLTVALALQFVAIMLTMTRGAWLALIAGLVTVALLVRGRAAAVVGLVLVVALVAISFVNFHVQKGRSIPELIHSGLDIDASTRVVLWDIAWDLFKGQPLLGVGMGDYTTEANELLSGRRVTTTVDAHNVYLHVLATRGLVGFVPFVLFWVVLFRVLFKLKGRLRKGSLDHQYAVGAIAVAVAVLTGALTELNLDDGEVMMAFLFVMGLALSRSYVRAEGSGEIGDVGAAVTRAPLQE